MITLQLHMRHPGQTQAWHKKGGAAIASSVIMHTVEVLLACSWERCLGHVQLSMQTCYNYGTPCIFLFMAFVIRCAASCGLITFLVW